MARRYQGPLLAAANGMAAETKETGHDRTEMRRARVIAAPDLGAKHNFPGLSAIGVIERRHACGPKCETRTRYFALSKMLPPQRFLETVRSHWDIENGLHWTLDLVFNEGRHRTRKDHGPDNLAHLHRFAMNVLRADKSKGALIGKQNAPDGMPPFFSTYWLKCDDPAHQTGTFTIRTDGH